MTLVTIWDTLANNGAGSVAVEITSDRLVPNDPEDPGAGYTTEILASRPLERIGAGPRDGDWVRPVMLNTREKRLDPIAAGAKNFKPGWVSLVVRDERPVPGADEQPGDAHDGGVADLEAGEMVYTWAPVARPLADRKAAMEAASTARFQAKRDGGTVVTIGQNQVLISTIHEAAVELREATAEIAANGGPMKVVTRSKAVAPLTEQLVAVMLSAIRAHVRACQGCEAALYEAIAAAADHASLDLIDVEAGTVDGVGGWPA